MRRILVHLLVIAMLCNGTAKALHFCGVPPAQGSPATHELIAIDSHSDQDQHALDCSHCDRCFHGSTLAVGASQVARFVAYSLAEKPLAHRDVFQPDPLLSGLERPPRLTA